LEILLNSFKIKPQILALTEVNYKNKDISYEIQELNISGYIMYHNIQNKGERGVSFDLDSIFLKSISLGPEFVFIKLELGKGQPVIIGNVYRSSKSTQADDLHLCNELNQIKSNFICSKHITFKCSKW